MKFDPRRLIALPFAFPFLPQNSVGVEVGVGSFLLATGAGRPSTPSVGTMELRSWPLHLRITSKTSVNSATPVLLTVDVVVPANGSLHKC